MGNLEEDAAHLRSEDEGRRDAIMSVNAEMGLIRREAERSVRMRNRSRILEEFEKPSPFSYVETKLLCIPCVNMCSETVDEVSRVGMMAEYVVDARMLPLLDVLRKSRKIVFGEDWVVGYEEKRHIRVSECIERRRRGRKLFRKCILIEGNRFDISELLRVRQYLLNAEESRFHRRAAICEELQCIVRGGFGDDLLHERVVFCGRPLGILPRLGRDCPPSIFVGTRPAATSGCYTTGCRKTRVVGGNEARNLGGGGRPGTVGCWCSEAQPEVERHVWQEAGGTVSSGYDVSVQMIGRSGEMDRGNEGNEDGKLMNMSEDEDEDLEEAEIKDEWTEEAEDVIRDGNIQPETSPLSIIHSSSISRSQSSSLSHHKPPPSTHLPHSSSTPDSATLHLLNTNTMASHQKDLLTPPKDAIPLAGNPVPGRLRPPAAVGPVPAREGFKRCLEYFSKCNGALSTRGEFRIATQSNGMHPTSLNVFKRVQPEQMKCKNVRELVEHKYRNVVRTDNGNAYGGSGREMVCADDDSLGEPCSGRSEENGFEFNFLFGGGEEGGSRGTSASSVGRMSVETSFERFLSGGTKKRTERGGGEGEMT